MIMTGTSFMLTEAQKAQLRALGYSDADIASMKPERGHEILGRRGNGPTTRGEIKQESSQPPRGTQAIEFLCRLRPSGSWVITTIPPDGGPTCTRTFSDLEAARRFIVERGYEYREGIYYTANHARGEPRSKPKKEDIIEVEFLHVDADPNDDETPDQFKARLLPMIEKFQPRPTFVIHSGNGVQLLWRLDRPGASTDDEVIKDIEARNVALAEQLGAPRGTQNIDRVLRLPGTWNYPNAKKRKAGRVKCWASVIKHNNVAHPLSAFPAGGQATAKQTKQSTASSSELPKRIRADLFHTSGAGYGSDRSGLLWAFLCKAVRAGIADQAIIDACLDRAFADCAIHEHCREEGGETYIRRQIARARAECEKHGASHEQETRPLMRRCIDQFERREIEWLWYPFIPLGMATMMMGDKEVGKSTVLSDIEARISTGGLWPRFGDDPEESAPLGSVIILCKENDFSRIIRPRLEAAGADLKRIHTLGYEVPDDPEQFDPLERLDTTIKELERHVREIGDVRLIRIDPMTDYVGKIDYYRDEQARTLLNPLVRLAAKYNLAIVYVLHLNKKDDLPVRYRHLGGVAFRNVAQSSLLVAKSELPEERIMALDAGNLIPERDRRAVSFVLLGPGSYPRVNWGSHWQDVDLDELMTSKKLTKKERAQLLLEQWLAAGPVLVEELRKRTKEAGISWRTMEEAKREIGAVSQRPEPFSPGAKWKLDWSRETAATG
jgi:hypothetical protein